MSTKASKATETARATQFLAGFKKHLGTVTSLTILSVAYTPDQITKALEVIVALYAAVDAAKAVVKVKLAAEAAQAPAILSLLAGLVAYVKLTYAGSPDVLADFGLLPRKVPTPMTAEQKAVANAKRKATRAARGITTVKEKMAKVGDVVGLSMTPIKAGPVVTSSTAPTPPPPRRVARAARRRTAPEPVRVRR